MSWSVGGSGKSNELAKQIEEQFESTKDYPCPEPEESIKQDARKLIAKALAGNNPERVHSVYASGSQSTHHIAIESEPRVTNSLKIEIT